MKTRIAMLAATLCAATAVPALAAWDEVGVVRIDQGRDRESRSFNMGGSIEALQFRAEGGRIMCRAITARFGNGRTQTVFRGTLEDGQPRAVDLPGRERNITRIDFDCGADNRRGARIHVVADVGRYREEWRRSPQWQNQWSRIFNWGSNMVNDWRYLDSVRFEGRGDREGSFAGWRGQRVEAVALRPLESDARCSRVTARFGNGRSQPLDVNRGDVLRRGQYYKLDLPGRARDLTSLDMRCQAMGASRVTVQIYTSR
ncbi:MAG TPA: hypothetical protein VFQ69_03400 [Rhizomicrobium sp.]|nr:hypothetical protein [Rhizomicrobium sp.]